LWSADFKNQLEKFSRDELNALDSDGHSLLSYSLMHKDEIVVEYLLKDLGLDPNIHANSLMYTYIVDGKKVIDKSPMWKAALQNYNTAKVPL
jgi:hypothetical protein